MDILKDNKTTSMLVNFGIGFLLSYVLFMVVNPEEADSQWKLALGVGAIALATPVLGNMVIQKY